MPSPEGAKTCPFCGALPVWLSKSNAYGTGASGMEAPSRALGCDNPKCPVKPHTWFWVTMDWKDGYYFKVDNDALSLEQCNKRSES